MLSDASPISRNAIGPHGPISRAMSEGSRKIALPITWLTPIAVRSQRPSSRRNASGAAADVDVAMFADAGGGTGMVGC